MGNNNNQEASDLVKRDMAMSYAYKNEYLEIQHRTMKALQQKFNELEELSKSQSGSLYMETIKAMASIGQAILQS